jgi:hypothetical protein
MKVSNMAATMAGIVALTASATAGLTIWLLLTAPATVGSALGGHDVTPLVRMAIEALYEALSGLARYL